MLVLLTTLLLCNYVLAYDGEPRAYYDLEEAEDLFSWFVETYNKTYTKHETKLRLHIFKENLKTVNTKNIGLSSPVFGITQFSDLTSEEFTQKYTCFTFDADVPYNPNVKTEKDVQPVNAPAQFDWREKNVVTSVKDQGICGACWAFAATGSVEAVHAKATGMLVDLSPQQLLDCDKQSNGCNGGFPSYAYQSIINLGGQEKESDYPFTASTGRCAFEPSKAEVKLRTFSSFSIQDEEKVKELLYQSGPLSIGIDSRGLHYYNGGILVDCPLVDINHAVLLVGYGTENGIDYWIIKNSWGTGFGEQGYVRIKRGVKACGITESYFEHAD